MRFGWGERVAGKLDWPLLISRERVRCGDEMLEEARVRSCC